MSNTSNVGISVVRTLVPVIAGWVLSLPVSSALGLTSDQVTTGLTMALTGAYYVAVRLLEHANPKFGWLLGAPIKPTYAVARKEG